MTKNINNIYLFAVEVFAEVITELTSLIMGALEHLFNVPGPLLDGLSTSIAVDDCDWEFIDDI